MIIQFSHLEHMLQVLPLPQVIRVEPLETLEPNAGYRVRFAVHVRAQNRKGDVLTCCLDTKTAPNPSAQDRTALRQQANDLACDVDQHLEALGYEVRHGLIDIGPTEVIPGHWAGSRRDGDAA
ncbi:MAG: hypothetical protein KKA73_07825 [Chloroflexi bacterium]|nr:hypothetical protein [Chloroflexota bacterium]MBU1747581.1 hypothetical protein [Chloroflexota bacterium]